MVDGRIWSIASWARRVDEREITNGRINTWLEICIFPGLTLKSAANTVLSEVLPSLRQIPFEWSKTKSFRSFYIAFFFGDANAMYNVFMQPSNGGLVSFVPMIGMQSVFKNDAMPIDSQQFYSAFFNGDADGMRKAINDQKKFWPSIKAQLAAPCK